MFVKQMCDGAGIPENKRTCTGDDDFYTPGLYGCYNRAYSHLCYYLSLTFTFTFTVHVFLKQACCGSHSRI